MHRARAITSISPATLLQHLIEAFAGTGFERHLQFVENTQRYARQFREFIVDTDRGDPKSRHIINIREGMSQKPVSPEAVPKFEDTFNLSKDFNTRAVEILLLGTVCCRATIRGMSCIRACGGLDTKLCELRFNRCYDDTYPPRTP